MNQLRSWFGLAAAIYLLLSSAGHSLIAWDSLRAALESSGTPPQLLRSIGVGWHFGGLAMLVFSGITLANFAHGVCGKPTFPFPSALIGSAYAGFGSWAIAFTDNLFFQVLVAPGVVLLLASWPLQPRDGG